MQISYGEYFIQVNMKDSSSKVKLVSFVVIRPILVNILLNNKTKQYN
jgi:hypothetical protein